MGTIFFSPGSSVNRNAIAPAIGSPLLVQESLLFASLPSCAKRFPNLFTGAVRAIGRLISQLDAGLGQAGNHELPVPLFADLADMIAVENDALHGLIRPQGFALHVIEISIVHRIT